MLFCIALIYEGHKSLLNLYYTQFINFFSDSVPMHTRKKVIKEKYTRASASLKKKLEKMTDMTIPDEGNDQGILDDAKKAKK